MVKIQQEYLAAGGNRHPSAADWDSVSGILAYGTDRNIALWSPLDGHKCGVQALLCGHTDHVNAIKFFPNVADQTRIILSGSADKTVRVWCARSKTTATYQLAATANGHSNSVNCLAVCKGSSLVVSGSADATVRIWQLRISEHDVVLEPTQTIQPKPRLFPLALSLHSLRDADGLFLAVAGTASIVLVYVASNNEAFDQQATLTGHEGWIRNLAITRETRSTDSDLLLASASQDKYVRLWRIKKEEQQSRNEKDSSADAFEKSLSNKCHRLQASRCSYTVFFEALLLGHEDWVYTLAWRLDESSLQLLSASADSSLAIWQSEDSSGVWVCTARLGEISAQKGSTTATGSTGGFWIGLWSPNGDGLVSLGRTGGWRLWSHRKDQNRWVQGVAVSGHTKPVTDVAWSKDGSYILSTSSDQTTRLHAPIEDKTKSSWHEMGRPQIHGYDLNCIDSIGQTQFISGADEKLLRVFDEPRATAGLLERLCGIKICAEQGLPDAADIPVLGLSNKAVEKPEVEVSLLDGQDGTKPSTEEGSDIHASVQESDHPPFEDQLARHTLWPEKEKLYGHGYEIAAVAASHDSKLVATSCKASTLEHAVIRVYRTQDWREVRPSLTAHTLTATAICFSEDDQYLLTVGRDRKWAVSEKDPHGAESYLIKHENPKGHSRMILDACWAPLKSGRVFATASRDKNFRVWKFNDVEYACLATISMESSVTALAIAPQILHDTIVIASGMETGEVFLHGVQIEDWTARGISELDKSLRPSKSITRLAWRPLPAELQDSQTLAIASDDSSLRIFTVSDLA